MKQLLSLVAGLLLLAGVPRAQVDVVFVVDTATNMAAQDASASRLDTVHAILELTRDRGPQRVGVMRIAGRSDLGSGGAEVLAPLALSGDAAADRAAIDDRLRPAIDGLDASGTAKEIRYTLAAVADSWGSGDGPLWIVVLTDGLEDALDTNSSTEAADVEARALEILKAEKGDGYREGFHKPKRDHYQQASRELLLAETPAALDALRQSRGSDVIFTLVNVDPTGARLPLMDELAAATGGNGVIELDGPGRVRGAAEEAVAQSPFPPASGAGVVIHDGSGADDDGAQEFHVYQGTRSARIVVVADHPEYTLALSGPGGAGAADEVGAGRSIRSLEMLASPPAHGGWTLTLTNTGAAPLNARSELFYDLDLALDVTPPAGGTLTLGEPLELTVALVDFAGRPVTDERLLSGGSMRGGWSGPGLSGGPSEWTPAVEGGATRHVFAAVPSQPSDAATFRWEASAELTTPGDAWSGSRDGQVSMGVRQPGVHLTRLEGGDGEASGNDLAFSSDFIDLGTTWTASYELAVDVQGSAVPVSVAFEPSAAYRDAGADGVKVSVDGRDATAGLSLSFEPSQPKRTVTVELSSGFSGEVGRLVARIDGRPDAPSDSAAFSMGKGFGALSGLALLVLLLIAFLVWRKLQAAAKVKAWEALLANLGDDAVLMFEDDEPAGRKAA